MTIPKSKERLAKAKEFITSFGKKQRLLIFRDDVLVIRCEYSGSLLLTELDDVIKIHTSTISATLVTTSADIATGTWQYVFQGGTNYLTEYRGSVGALGSDNDIILSESPKIGDRFTSSFCYIIPAEINPE